jgi:hypothetical protein
MTNRLAKISLVAMSLITVISPTARAQDTEQRRATLKGIGTVNVSVEELTDSAKRLGLTDEIIQTDVELKLRLAGMRVVTLGDILKVPGMPSVYVRVTVTDRALAASMTVELQQNARLERDDQSAIAITTWQTGYVLSNPDAQAIRSHIKDEIDEFLNAWLSVNPKK